jgi:predicted polyphosphate/ATP-dependent NAD kinase
MKKLGLIINPIAGMGGTVGLKGTDGEKILLKAIKLGAELVAPARSIETLRALSPVKSAFELITYPYEMGEDEAKKCEFSPTVIGSIRSGKTTALDTKRAVKNMMEIGTDLILFVGGDGTARDIYEAVEDKVPVLGIPAGVKIFSAVFSVDPQAAARIAMRFMWDELPLREAEVMDVDEKAYRKGKLSSKLYGYMLIPYEPHLVQGVKVPSLLTEGERSNQLAIAKYMVEEMEPNVVYVIGPGTTTRKILEVIGGKKTLLGVDLVCNKKLIAKDVNEKQILERIKGRSAKIIVTPIGGQGFIFGRGNLQISPRVIKGVGKEQIIVVSTKHKLMDLKNLRVDTRDSNLDAVLRGYIRVITDYREEAVIRVE